MLDIHCHVGSVLRVVGCQLLRADNGERHHYHHHHLETCPEYVTQPNTPVDNELEKAETATSGLKQDSDNEHHLHHHHRHHHLYEDFDRSHQQKICSNCVEPKTARKTTASCVKTVTVSDCLCIERSVDSDQVAGSVTTSELCCEPWSTTAHSEEIPPLSSVLDTASDEQTNSQHHQHCHHHCDVNCPNTETLQNFTSHFNMKDDWFYLDRAVIGELNDVFWVEGCLKALRQLTDHQQQQQQQQQHQLIISSQTPSMFPIAALQLGLVSSVCFLDLDPIHRPLIGRLLSTNSVSEDHVTYGRPWQRDITSVLFVDIVSNDGSLRQNVFEVLAEARSVLSAV